MTACDASSQGFGGHLYQIKDDVGTVCTIEYVSRRTTESESNRHSSHLELSAVKWACEKFRPTVGWCRIHLHTDCEAVVNMLNSDKINWATEEWKLSIYSNNIYKISHTKGAENRVADGFSRVPTQPSGDDITPNIDYGGVTPDAFWVGLDNTDELRHRFRDDDLLPVILYLTKLEQSDRDAVVRRAALHYIHDGKLYRRGKGLKDLEVISKAEGKKLAKLVHNTNGHFGRDIMIQEIQRSKTWPGIVKEVSLVCGSCVECWKYGVKQRKVLSHTVQRFTPFDTIAVDYLKLPHADFRCHQILIAIDVCTKFIWARPVYDPVNQRSTIACLNDLAQKYRLPSEILSDNDGTIMGKDVQAYFPELIFTQCAPNAHVGSVENANHQVLNRLRRLVKVDIDNMNKAVADNARRRWEDWLPASVVALNNRPVDVLGGLSPKDVMFGIRDDRIVPADFEQRYRAKMTMEDELASDLQHHRTKRNIAKAAKPFKVGDLVEICKLKDINSHQASRKLYIKWHGPWRITFIRRNSATVVDSTNSEEKIVSFEYVRHWQGNTVPPIGDDNDLADDGSLDGDEDDE
ncbi:hypothetical protein NCC49_004783 [Naganishia albida]|nr:hypothetical protein NCC49_004783 [Naganishia albida]